MHPFLSGKIIRWMSVNQTSNSTSGVSGFGINEYVNGSSSLRICTNSFFYLFNKDDDDCQGMPDFDEELVDDVFEGGGEQEFPVIAPEKRTRTQYISSNTSSSSGSTTTSSFGSLTSSSSSSSFLSLGTKVSMLDLEEGDEESKGSPVVRQHISEGSEGVVRQHISVFYVLTVFI